MSNDLLTRWTSIITNIAIVVGLVFVGLEFRNTTRAVEAERIDSFIAGNAEINALLVENENLAELLYKAHATPDSLTVIDLDRTENWLLMNYDSFRRQTLAYQAGLVPEDLYQQQKVGIGFVFISEPGLDLIELFIASGVSDTTWEAIRESATVARKYCLDSANRCMARYEAIRKDGRDGKIIE
jgi:hypothetical protein